MIATGVTQAGSSMQVTNLQSGNIEQAEQIVRQARDVFASGGLVVFPTETVYGVGASVASERGYQALRQVKERTEAQPFTIHLPNAEAALRYGDFDSPVMHRLFRKVFPGPVTLVLDVSDDEIGRALARMKLPASHAGRIYHNRTVGLRCPDDAIALRVLGSIDAPIAASSANRHGEPPPQDAEAAAAAMGDAAELVIDGGRCRYAKASTVVHVMRARGIPHIRILRQGVYDERFIRKLLRWTMLVVCSGNTCRSPMAEVMAQDMMAQERGLKADELESAGVRIVSAGTMAMPGLPATAEARQALASMDLDLMQHRSRPLSHELLHEADVIYCMTEAHRQTVLDMAPAAAAKTLILDPQGQDIEDPIGSDVEAYRRCAGQIRRLLELRLKEQWS
ncbi:MAG: Sua5/YciO/YrdC/YwlC family protein [Phycisphaeraceae bacterium]